LRYITIAALIAFMGATGSRPRVDVHAAAPFTGAVARISGADVAIVEGKRLRAEKGFVLVSTPADVTTDVSQGDYYFRLEPDTAWIKLEVRDGGNVTKMTSNNVVIRLAGPRPDVVGGAPKLP
jgi:hypothetical protein